MSQREDQADVERVLRGDLSAFEGIVARWQGPLVNLAYRYCRDRGRSEDMAQEAFLRAYRGLSKWRGESAFSTWLFALAVNHYRTAVKMFPAGFVEMEAIADFPGPADDPYAALAQERREQRVREAVLALPPKYRDCLVLFYFHEMDVAAAAGSLGLPEGTVKARLSRGRDLLRAKWERGLTGLALKEVR